MSEINSEKLELRRAMQHDFWGQLVVERATNRLLAGVGHNPHRAWAFPLCTPRGINVLQEYAFDHPFHNGIFVAQGDVLFEGERSNFWAPAPDWRQAANAIFDQLGELRYGEPPASESITRGFRFTYRTTWSSTQRSPLLEEERSFSIHATDDATICDLASRKTATYGDVTFEKTKYGSLGVRIQPQLLPVLGGEIVVGIGNEISRGTADQVAPGKELNWVAYESDVPVLGRFGLFLAILENSTDASRCGPWFIRDYGLATFNATMHAPIHLAKGRSWNAILRVAAYDGPITLARADRWRRVATP